MSEETPTHVRVTSIEGHDFAVLRGAITSVGLTVDDSYERHIRYVVALIERVAIEVERDEYRRLLGLLTGEAP